MWALLLACATPVDMATAAEPGGPAGGQGTDDPADCRTSCSLGDHVEDDGLDAGQIGALFELWNEQVIGEPTLELETLLFYSGDVQSHLNQVGAGELDSAHHAFLQRELSRDRVSMEMRLLDDAGQVRGTLTASDVPLRQKQHIRFTGTGSLGHLETGGKVKRVGLGHLWSRW